MDFYFFSFTNTAVFIHCFFHFLMQIFGGRAGLTSFSRSFSVHLTEHHMECFMKQFFAPPGRSAGTAVDAVRVQRRCHPNRGVDSARRLRHAVEALRRGLALLISGKAVKKAVHHALPSGTLRGAHVAPQRCTILRSGKAAACYHIRGFFTSPKFKIVLDLGYTSGRGRPKKQGTLLRTLLFYAFSPSGGSGSSGAAVLSAAPSSRACLR